MKYDLFFVSKTTIDAASWLTFKTRFPLAQKIENVKSFSDISSKSFTKLFWIVWNDVLVLDESVFEFVVPRWDEQYVHVFKHNDQYNGIALCAKTHNISSNELLHRFFVNKKEINWQVSTSNYDIVFVSYKEPNADELYDKLKTRFPRAKRVHGITGIHQAHIEAAKLSTTHMFWVVDGDAEITNTFDFSYATPSIDFNAVHVWRSINPINNLIYGYGGVKLLPTWLTLKLDVNSTDMTTSISHKFKAMPDISNITQFNTDPYNTWKSAFRECVKLSSKVIERQQLTETNDRLNTWCTVNNNSLYGADAIAGANAGKDYGLLNINNPESLRKINDFNWLYERWKSSQL